MQGNRGKNPGPAAPMVSGSMHCHLTHLVRGDRAVRRPSRWLVPGESEMSHGLHDLQPA